MAIIVNGVEITDDEVANELPHHRHAPQPLRSACIALVLKQVLLDEAAALGHPVTDVEAAADWLLETQVTVPEVDEAACRRHYRQHAGRFRQGGWVEAAHILFAVQERSPLSALRQLAQDTLELLQVEPARFAEMAARHSNCPSGVDGGALGRLQRGECVPEFEAALWRIPPGTLADGLVESRHGLHIVRVDRRHEGQLLPFEAVAEDVAAALQATSRDLAWRQYAQWLLGRARIEGIELDGARTPLLQ